MTTLTEQRLVNAYLLGARDFTEGRQNVPPVYVTGAEATAYSAGYRHAELDKLPHPSRFPRHA